MWDLPYLSIVKSIAIADDLWLLSHSFYSLFSFRKVVFYLADGPKSLCPNLPL